MIINENSKIMYKKKHIIWRVIYEIFRNILAIFKFLYLNAIQ